MDHVPPAVTPAPPGGARHADRRHPDVRSRLHGSALGLFRRHGIAGTSLQMIADDLGVTKAAVYYHYRTKDELVRGVLRPLVEGMGEVVAEAEAEADPRLRREVALTGLADVIVRFREVYAVFTSDPSLGPMSDLAPDLVSLGRRAQVALLGPHPAPSTQVRVSMLLWGLVGPLRDPTVRDLDDDTVRDLVVRAGRSLLAG